MQFSLPDSVSTAASFKGHLQGIERMRLERYHDPELWVEFRINPTKLSIQSRKVINRVQTNTRWVFQHWGMEPYIISYSGVTGYIRSLTREVGRDQSLKPIPESIKQYDIRDFGRNRDLPRYDTAVSPYETPAWTALQRLRKFYLEPHERLQGRDLTRLRGDNIDEELSKSLLRFYYRESMYIGYLTMMEISEEEMSPWMWSYEMEFQAFEAFIRETHAAQMPVDQRVAHWSRKPSSSDIDPQLAAVGNASVDPTGSELARQQALVTARAQGHFRTSFIQPGVIE